MVFRHVYDEEKCYIPPCLWRGKHIDTMSMARKDAMSMPREKMPCLWQEKRDHVYGLWMFMLRTRSWTPTLLCSFLPLACDWGPHEVDELLVFAGLRDQWCKECPQEMITTLEGRKSLEGLWALNFPAPVEEGLGWSLGILSLLRGSFRREVGF